MIQINFFEDINLAGYTLIEGFPGAGLVGAMANSYIIEKLKMEYIGYIDSNLFPPIAVIHNTTPMFPVRIYADKKNKLLTVTSEFTIPTESVRELGIELLSFAKRNGVSTIISIGGIPTEKPSTEAFIISTDKKMLEKAAANGVKAINDGVIAGISAIILASSPIMNIPIADILVEVNPEITDPKYAEIALSTLNKLLDLKIDLQELEEEAKIVEAKIRQMIRKAKLSHESYKKATDATGPSMYA
ncbi:MAG: proteasome assembly chaperone family protein [Candidatus Micrarchaeales archaeon]